MRRHHRPPTKMLLAALSFIFILAFAASAFGTMPAANTQIGNQASATYTGSDSLTHTATSNTVYTTVQQVAAVSLIKSQTLTGAPGTTVYFPHTVTNNGNGNDTFNLTDSVNPVSLTPTSVAFYPDSSCSGKPDTGSTPITVTPQLTAGASWCFVVAAGIPSSAVTGNYALINATATSQLSSSISATDQDTLKANQNAVMYVNKSLSASSGAPGTTITVTLQYGNNGNNTATNFAITDYIGTGSTSGMTYITNSASWNGTPLNSDNYNSGGLTYTWNAISDEITATIGSVAPNATGTLSFQVSINSNDAPGTANTSNTACFSWFDGATQQPSASGCTSTNTATYNVSQAAGVTITTSAPNPVPAANQGATLVFTNPVTNTGNGTDSFNISFITNATNPYPAGTSFSAYQNNAGSCSGSLVPLVGAISNLGVGQTYNLCVQVTLPGSASGNNGGLGYSEMVKATSVFDGITNASTADNLTTITQSTVELEGYGANQGGPWSGTDAIFNATTPSVGSASGNPGATLTYRLKVDNTSNTSDAYNLLVRADSTSIQNPSTNTNALPAGWTSITFLQDTSAAHDCSSTAALTGNNTGTIAAGGTGYFCAQVGIPPKASAGSNNLYFRALSPTTGAWDAIYETATVNTVRSITLTPNGSNQIYPGGTVTYTFNLCNQGDVTEGDGTNSTIALTNADSLSGWSATIYYDANNDGVLDGGDTQINSGSNISVPGGLLNGTCATVFLKVFAPPTANAGDIDVSTLTALTTGTINGVNAPADAAATGTSTVIAGQVRLDKYQYLDANCSASCSDATTCSALGWTQTALTTGAVPGACIRYKVVATNQGTTNATGLTVQDTTPSNTQADDGSRTMAGGTCNTGSASAPAWATSGTVTGPACGSTGTISDNIGTLAPGASVTIYFGVMINNQ